MTRRPHHARSRHLVLLLAVVGLVAGLAAPVSAADPAPRHGGTPLPVKSTPTPVLNVPAGVIGFKSYLGWVYDDDSIAIVGEVLNNTTSRRKAVNLKVTYFDSADPGASALGSTTDSVLIEGVAKGAVGPFVVFKQTPPPGTAAFQIEITSSTATTTPPAGGLDIVNGTSYVNSGTRWYPGSIKNNNTFAVDAVRVDLTAYDSSGNVGEVMVDEPTGPIPAGGSASFLIGIADDFGPNFTMAKVKFLADGFRADQPTAYVTSWANYFDDIAGNSFKEDIIWMAEQAITKGCSPGKFCPTANVRRDEMASFLARSLGLSGSAPDAFIDDNGNTHEKNINLVAKAGITTGCSPSHYCPEDNVKRDQMASFLARALELTGTAPDAFTDDNGNTHEKNIDLVAQAGVTTGCGGTKYCPKSLVTRGQMAAFLRRAFD